MLSRLFDLAIDEREVELAFVRLNQLPTHGADDRVQVHGREFVPDGLHVLDAGCT